MIRNNKGQALIEFVIILPVLIMLIFSFIDLGRIILENNRLENLTTNVINRYAKNKDYNDVKNYIKSLGYDDIELSIKQEKSIIKIKLEKEVDLITPGIDSILGNPYNVKVERIVDYEE
jgi:deoxyhypusine synthase